MPRKLAVLGVAVSLAVVVLSQSGRAGAEIQTFTPVGGEIVESRTCYQGAAPTSLASCGAGSSPNSVSGTTGDPLTIYSVIRHDAGARLSLPITYTHPAFFGADPAISTVTGEVTTASDLLCNSGAADILATPSSTTGSWPGSTWDGFDFVRIGDSNDALPAGDAYVDVIRPQPPSFAFASSDLTTLTHAWLSGVLLLPIATPAKLNLAAYTSPYGAGFRSSVALLAGDPATPPTDGYLCLDTPQHSVNTTSASANMVIPPPTSYVRYTLFTSEPDIFDGTTARILDVDCVGVNTGPVCDITDADGDLLPGGVEASFGSSNAAADVDGDGSNDYAELFNFTNPTVADTDGDGSVDLADIGADEGSGSDIDDTTADDNCPAHANGTQLNEDFEASLAGPGPGSQTDETNPDQDPFGDACDNDDDNDALSDLHESALTIVAWSGNTDPGGVDAPDTTVCKGPGIGAAPAVVMNPLDSDSDDDIYLDGIECQMSSRPDLADPAVGSCSTSPVDPDGCALRKPSLAGGDTDDNTGASLPAGDYLYHPTSASGHSAVEAFYRTRQINLDGATQTQDTDGDTIPGDDDKDADNDGIADGPEVWSYGTSPANQDTDGDACTDGKEAADINGNRVVNAADIGTIANPATYGSGPGGPYRASNGTITAQIWKKNADHNRNGTLNAQDHALVGAQAVIGGGACNSPIITGPSYSGAAGTSQKGRIIVNQLAP